ncbi:hypothetical protein CAL7716_102220 (plasmid) [Calothrix sp. PCC 7716]|nr:hypothetical protein CAL7716_102220 [Calothrix sp. PCC 7716]
MNYVIRSYQNNRYERMNQYFNSDALKNKIPKHIGQIMPNNIDISDINFQFNTVMKQLSFGMSVDSFIAEHPIKEWVEFTSTYTNTQGNKYYNIDLSYQYSNEVYLIENYDFIIINNNSVTAFDWSTSKAQDTKWLENAWKTKLRLFLLPENFAIKCENISLLYLFPNSKETCQIWYSLKQHKANFKTIGSTVNSAISKPVTEKIPVMENQYYHTAWLTETSVKEDFDAIPEIQL